MSPKEVTDHEPHMTAATVEKELTELHNCDPIIIRDYRKDKKLYQDPMEEFYAQVVLNQESSAPSF
jgi:hypothetical protein